MSLSQYIGESRTHRLKLTFNGQPFDPAGHTLLATAKWNPLTDTDEESCFQKQTGAGITTESESGAFWANIAVVPEDTAGDLPGWLTLDIVATDNATGARKYVATDRLELRQPVSRTANASTPIYTTEPLSPDSALAQMQTKLTAATAAQTAAEAAASSAATSATAAASSASSAAQDASTATTQAGVATTAAGQASASATAAAASATSAGDSATAASNSATAAADSAAAASSSASAAAGSATAAATSSSSSATSATAASASADTAISKAGEANASATAAASSAAGAAASADTASAKAAQAASSAVSASASASTAEGAAQECAFALDAVGRVMVLVSHDETSATLVAGAAITVTEQSTPYPTAVITFPD